MFFEGWMGNRLQLKLVEFQARRLRIETVMESRFEESPESMNLD